MLRPRRARHTDAAQHTHISHDMILWPQRDRPARTRAATTSGEGTAHGRADMWGWRRPMRQHLALEQSLRHPRRGMAYGTDQAHRQRPWRRHLAQRAAICRA